jgi:hypothetical protein
VGSGVTHSGCDFMSQAAHRTMATCLRVLPAVPLPIAATASAVSMAMLDSLSATALSFLSQQQRRHQQAGSQSTLTMCTAQTGTVADECAQLHLTACRDNSVRRSVTHTADGAARQGHLCSDGSAVQATMQAARGMHRRICWPSGR